jgi:uncharacterized protein YyaL (SSP411 family)
LVSERLDLARRIGDAANEALALAMSTRLPAADVAAAEAAFGARAEWIDPRARMEAALRLYEATSKAACLTEAKRLLDESLSQFDAEDRARALANIRLNREIAAAAKAAGL